jgi:phosphatidylethanolamine/phosphatidyl-N-methylethanolamine N-methyltransferase
LDIQSIKKAYRRYAKVYDFYFGAVFQPGRKAVVDKINWRAGDRVLEVGVGTGLSLPLYPSFVKVTGIDISAEMLARAHARCAREGLANVRLNLMDAENMQFADDAFDKVIAMYVASCVPNPTALVDEMRRVCKPSGELIIVNHFQSDNPVIGRVENLLAPLSRLLGFRPHFSLDSFAQEAGLSVVDESPVNLFGYWKLLRARNNKVTSAPEVSEPVPALHRL